VSRSIVRQLVVKDLYLVRWMILGSLVAGSAALAIMPVSPVSAYVGGVSFICVLVILNIVLVMHNVVQEKKDKALLFALSLPVSTTQFIAAKVVATAIGFVGPWVVLTTAAIVVIDASTVPNGILPFLITVLGYLLGYHFVLLGTALLSDSAGWHATVITVGNVSVNFLIPFLLGLPSVAHHRHGPTAVWSADIAAILGVEIAAGVAALCLAVYLCTRRRDFV
jgi:ABC-type transport system involved in multi-copper enzyme maturation permease subunit